MGDREEDAARGGRGRIALRSADGPNGGAGAGPRVAPWTLGSLLLAGALLAGSAACGGSGETGSLQSQSVSSCMLCHNGTLEEHYAGSGIEDPHPFGSAAGLDCTICHGGNPDATSKEEAHIPPPPQIGDNQKLATNALAYFNRLTLAGIDKFPDYTSGGVTHTALDYLQFINPGDLRVTQTGQGCGQCHTDHSETVSNGLLATATGIFSGAQYAIGAENAIPANQGLHLDTAADLGSRAKTDPSFNEFTADLGEVGELIEYPVYSVHNSNAPDKIHNNQAYTAANLLDDQLANGQVVTQSELHKLFTEQVAFTCGDCHLGSAGANNRAGDYRSSGCTACHMPYSLGGRSGSLDPHVNKFEPLDPDDIDAPERAHVRAHRIVSVHREWPGGVQMQGMDDLTCAGCHQGSNRTVMQYWGIRLDQNEDVRRNRQYPANPVSYKTTADDERLFDPVVDNNTFNGRRHFQYLAEEDYDGDGRDDTPADVHHEAGMGCIDCHGSYDLHGGKVSAGETKLRSRQEQAVAIRCESCHGGVDSYAPTVAASNYTGVAGQHAVDSAGNVLKHVRREADGHLYLYSKLTGAKHFVPQTRDVTVDTGVENPFDDTPLYSPAASFAMGRIDGNSSNGVGPVQQNSNHPGFSHTDRMDCATCHSAWTNTCSGCHLEGEYNTGNNFSNITGQRIVYRERFADFVYQTPLPFQLGINAHGKIGSLSANTKTFFRYKDINNEQSAVFAFTDRNGGGDGAGSGFPTLSHNAFMAHSIRGKVGPKDEGPRYCVACHLTENAVENWSEEYDAFRTAIANGDYGSLDFNLLKQHIGQNTGNQLDSPFYVHMAAGLGSGLFLFGADGAPVNPLDNDNNRHPNNVAPATVYDPANVVYDLDRLVEWNGISNASNNHALLSEQPATALRQGALDQLFAGPLGADILTMLADPVNGLVLDSWYDANGQPRGQAPGAPPGD